MYFSTYATVLGATRSLPARSSLAALLQLLFVEPLEVSYYFLDSCSISESISGSVSGFHLFTKASGGPHNPIRVLAAGPISDDADNELGAPPTKSGDTAKQAVAYTCLTGSAFEKRHDPL